jgi:hypothetical protein
VTLHNPTKHVHCVLPTLHADQLRAHRLREDWRVDDPTFSEAERELWRLNGRGAGGGRFKVGRCGRRYGKTTMAMSRAAKAVLKGKLVGWFAPEYKYLSEVYEETHDMLEPAKLSSNKSNMVIRSRSGGRIDFWSLDNERAGRSRKYHLVIIDEAGYTKPNMMSIWERSIKPTLFDYRGECLAISNTNGVADDNFLHQICKQPKYGFIEFHAPTMANPTIPELDEETQARLRRGEITPAEAEAVRAIRRAEDLAIIKEREHPLVFAQEYLAQFVNWSGAEFFSLEKLLVDGVGHPMPTKCDYVFATVDTAVKTGSKNDGTAICFWARNAYAGTPLILLDWDIIQVQGNLLEDWLAVQFQNLASWASRCGSRRNPNGIWIEDKASGMVLIMAAQNRGWDARAIPSPLTALGKDERAIAVSGYHYRGECKMTQEAHDKRTVFKGTEGNHFENQVAGFRIGVPNQSDDLLDAYSYGLSIALGGGDGV